MQGEPGQGDVAPQLALVLSGLRVVGRLHCRIDGRRGRRLQSEAERQRQQ